MMRRPLLALLLFAGFTQVSAYTVDSAGGPLTLPEDIDAAFRLWQEAGAPAVPAEDADDGTAFSFESTDRLGPDVVSLTIQRSGANQTLEIVVNPDLYRDFPAALLHETGIILGLAAGDEGVMAPELSGDGEATPNETDIEQLRAVASAVPGDLDRDGIVGFGDLLELASQLGRRGVNMSGDLDGDGEVTEDDLRVLREAYEFMEPSEPEPVDETEVDAEDEPVEPERESVDDQVPAEEPDRGEPGDESPGPAEDQQAE